MTRRFLAHFENGVLVPLEKLELPLNIELAVYVDTPEHLAPLPTMPRFDDPADPMPEEGAALIDWWARHRLPVTAGMADEVAVSPEFDPHGELDDDA